MLKLQFRDRRREAVWLVDRTFTIGKNSRNSLMIDSDGICEFHAELINKSETLTLINKAGGTGVWVNGLPISETSPVRAGDKITLGELELELIDPKHNIATQKPIIKKADWSLFSKASWLEKSSFPITGKLIIGRDASCDIALPLEHLSRQHCAIEIRSGLLYVSDLDSSNGTFLNGERIKESPVKAGDKIKLDVITFEVRGPTHDPHKTIIRTVPNKQRTKVREEHGTQNQKSKPVVTSKKAITTPKSLVASGKQTWISDNKQQYSSPKKGSSKRIFFLAGLTLALVSAGVLLMKLFGL